MKRTKSLLSIVYLLLIYSFSIANERNFIDSLNQLLEKYENEKTELRKNVNSINDSSIVNVLFKLSDVYCDSNITRSKDYAQQGFRLSDKIGFTKGKINAYLCFGNIYYREGNYETSTKMNKQALALCLKTKDYKAAIEAYLKLGTNNLDLGNYAEALKYYTLALETAEKYNHKEKIAKIYANIGIVYYYNDKTIEALRNFQFALKINLENGKKAAAARNYLGIAAMYDHLKNYDEAINYDLKALALAKEINDKIEISDAYNNLALTYFKIEKYDEALKYALVHLKMAEEIGSIAEIGGTYNTMGKIYFGVKKYGEADKYLKKALAIAQKTGSLFQLNASYQFLVINDSARGNYLDALAHYRMHVNARDSMYNKESTEKMLQTQIKYEFDKKEAATKAKQAIKDAIAKEEIQQQKIVILAVILGSGILVLVLVLIINRRKAKHSLQVNKLENKTLRSQLNPHFIFNALASIQKYMNEHPELAENYLAKFGKLMREVLESSEKEYIPLSDEFDMLKNYMDLEKLRVSNGFDYEFIIDEIIDTEEILIPPLLLQPIVENAIWHGVAQGQIRGKIIINVAFLNDFLQIEIENKNEDFSLKNQSNEETNIKRKSFGLQIVKERLSLLSKEKRKKGSLEMLPTPFGMKVKILLPF
jgi:tetratricopeptide (TPR) repeat protein